MAQVGTVSVKVVPDLEGFADAIREEIRRIVREELTAFSSGMFRGLLGEEEDVD